MPERVLIVEDNQVLRSSIARLLAAEAYEVAEAGDGAEGLAQVGRFDPDLVIMDINMPRMDGLAALQRLREFSTVPVLILSVRTSQLEKVVGLDTGADDYLPKPFGVDELLARVRALLRRRRQQAAPGESPAAVRLGGGELLIDAAQHLVLFQGQVVQLTPLEARLLFTLAERPGGVFTRQQLLDEVWRGDGGATDENLKLYILYLRRKLEPNPARPRYILTERGQGYRLAAV